MSRLGFLGALLITGTLGLTASSGPAYLVKDINARFGFLAASLAGWVEGPAVFFIVEKISHVELWKSDGTPAGSHPIISGQRGGSGRLGTAGSEVYFDFFEPSTGRELWKTDGTSEGTQLVKDIWPGANGVVIPFREFRGDFYFAADDGVHGLELWKTDGTEEGTTLVSDIVPGPQGSKPYDLAVVGDLLYVAIEESFLNYALVRSDGTAAGTIILRRFAGFVLCRFCGPTRPGNLTALGSVLLFSGVDSESGLEPWRSDGTPEGTHILKDIYTGPGSSFPTPPVRLGEHAYFTAAGPSTSQLWRTNGTPEGTVLVTVIGPAGPPLIGPSPPSLVAHTTGIFFAGSSEMHGREFWRSDGTADGTRLVKDIYPGPLSSNIQRFAVAGSFLFFVASDAEHGYELWRSDGTEAGTLLVADLAPGITSSNPYPLMILDDTLLFAAVGAFPELTLFRTDGRPSGTAPIRVLDSPGSHPSVRLTVGETAYFGAVAEIPGGASLWKTNGTEAGTVRLTNPPLEFAGSLVPFGAGGALFSATDPIHGIELWRIDATGLPRIVEDIQPGTASSYPRFLGSVGGLAVFLGDDLATGSELYRTDGTAEGTFLFKDIAAGPEGSNVSAAVELAGALYFSADDRVHGLEVWRSDGTTEGTHLVRDIWPGENGSTPIHLTVSRGKVYFAAATAPDERELWVTDGTSEGTALVADVPSGSIRAAPGSIVAASNQLFFLVSREGRTTELWRSDGSAEGTRLVRTFLTDAPEAQEIGPLVVSRGFVYFAARDARGVELWTSDGTAAGTFVVSDIRPGPLGSSPTTLTDVSGLLLFAANDGSTGWELWRSDGSASGTRLVDDIFAGPGSSHPTGFVRAGALVLFSADDGERGRELWALPFTALTGSRPGRPETRRVPFRP